MIQKFSITLPLLARNCLLPVSFQTNLVFSCSQQLPYLLAPVTACYQVLPFVSTLPSIKMQGKTDSAQLYGSCGNSSLRSTKMIMCHLLFQRGLCRAERMAHVVWSTTEDPRGSETLRLDRTCRCPASTCITTGRAVKLYQALTKHTGKAFSDVL